MAVVGGSSPPETVTPTEAVKYSSEPSTTIGAVIDSSTRRATRCTLSMPSTSSRTITNSSAPNRVTVSLVLQARTRRRATATRTWSPAAWPRASLTEAKQSRSTYITDTT